MSPVGEFSSEVKWSAVEDLESEVSKLRKDLRAALARIDALESPPVPVAGLIAGAP